MMQWLIRVYQFLLSPDESPFFRSRLRDSVCAHDPHCSAYAYESYDHYSFAQATSRTWSRVMRCGPAQELTYDPVVYRVVFASGSPIGVPFLQALMADPRFEVVGVLTMPDKPSGRGMKLQENVIAREALSLWIHEKNIYKPHSLRFDSVKYADEAHTTYDWMQSLDIDFLYTIAYGHIIPQEFLDLARIAPINIHGSLLPKYRGASPLQQVFVDGRSQTGVTLMEMEAGLDSGPMVSKQIFKLWFSDTAQDLIDRIMTETPSWSLNALDQYVHGKFDAVAQDESEATFCGKIKKEDGRVELWISNEKLEIRWPLHWRHSEWVMSNEQWGISN